MTKIALASDVHLEHATIILTNDEQADVLILSGDILTAYPLYHCPEVDKDGLIEKLDPKILWKPSHDQILAMRYRKFLDQVSKEFKNIIITPGNHEFYHGRFPCAIDWLRTEYSKYPNIHFLYNDSVEIDGITYLGATLWTDMNKTDPVVMYNITSMMNDFRIIRNSQHNFRRFLPGDAIKEHHKTVEYIKQVVDSDPNKTYVVVGHHAPSPLSVHPKYQNDVIMNYGYFSDLSNFILDRPQIKLFTHGHMHDPQIHYMGDTLIACNPRGYENHDEGAKDFHLRFIDLENMPEKFDGVKWGRE
jgi:Icc-related predicted phosphoesterase